MSLLAFFFFFNDDLFGDSYPEEFVIQVQTICERLASNYVNSTQLSKNFVEWANLEENLISTGAGVKLPIGNYQLPLR